MIHYEEALYQVIKCMDPYLYIILSSNKSSMEVFCYRLTQVHMEKWPLNWRERGMSQ